MKQLALLTLVASLVTTTNAMEVPQIPEPQVPDHSFSISDFGAVADGKTDNAPAIRKAIKACEEAGGGTVRVPAGTYFTGPFDLISNFRLQLDEGSVLIFSDNFDEYPVGIFTSLPERHRPLIGIENKHDIIVTGKGKLDGQGQKWWDDFRAHRRDSGFVERRPKFLCFEACERVRIEGITIVNAPMFHMSPTHTKDVTIDGVTVLAPGDSPNTDSCNPSGWNYLIQNCYFSVGDDNVAVKPFHAPGDGRASVENLYIRNCKFGTGHGLSVGGQTPGGLRNMHVENISFEGTDIGLRLKAERGDGGLVENVTYENITMKNVAQPIVITSYYHGLPAVGAKHETKEVNARTPIWKNVVIRNVTAEGAEKAGLLMGLPEMPIENLVMENVSISAKEPLRIGYISGAIFKDVKVKVETGSPVIIDDAVIGEGVDTLKQ